MLTCVRLNFYRRWRRSWVEGRELGGILFFFVFPALLTSAGDIGADESGGVGGRPGGVELTGRRPKWRGRRV